MRRIEFTTESNHLKVRIDGVLVPGVALDVNQVTAAKRLKAFTPIVHENFTKGLKSKLLNHGPNIMPNEMHIIMSRFEAEIDAA